MTPTNDAALPCCECGGEVIEFSVPNEAWNTIIRRNGKEHDREYLCLSCFAKQAAEAIERLMTERDELRAALDKMSHRKCWSCDHAGYYLSNTLPSCCCEACGSPDTRLIKATQ